MKVVDVAMATAAAPVYFPLARNDRGVFADGGLVGNAPGLFGLHEVKTFLTPKQDALIRILSIGTMTIGATVRGGASLDRGFGKWRGGLFLKIGPLEWHDREHVLLDLASGDVP